MKFKKVLPSLFLVALFSLTFIVNLQIGLFGDDYYYATFLKNDFWELHKTHYLEINGRAIVHLLDSIFLALPKIFWQILNSIMLTQKTLNPTLDIEGVLLTMLDSRTNIGLEVIEEIRKYFKDKVFNTIIPRLVRLVEAPSHGKPILEYEPRNKGTIAYLNLAKEVIERNGPKEESSR